MKRLFDASSAFLGLVLFSPILMPTMILIWLQDFYSPIYGAPRMLRPGKKFKMYKLRSMVANADKIGGTSTAGTDKRITWVGRFIRKCKLDEVSQLWNVFVGDMSLVGPRPQEENGASLYTDEENRLFEVRPGITDFSSIVFSDEGDILAGSSNPDLMYNQVIRPWKSRLGLLYINKRNFWLDLKLIALTFVSAVSRPTAIKMVQNLLRKLQADEQLIQVASRKSELRPFPPPGSEIVETRY
jgi:lipopolysaccharide/colanic/teichoic acid biosynthesis glycosyltransferase